MIEDAFELEAIRAVAVLDGHPDPRRRHESQTELMSLIEASTATRSPVRRSARATHRMRLGVPAWGIGALSGIAAAVAAAVVLIGHGGAVQPPSAAAAILERAAEAPAMVSPLHLGPNQYWYVEDVTAGRRAQNMRRCGNACYDIGVERWWIGARRYVSHYYVLADSARPTTITRTPPNVPMTAARYSPRWSGVGGGYDRIMRYQQMLTVPSDLSSLRQLFSHPLLSRNSPRPVSAVNEEQLIFGNIDGILSEPRVPARMLSGLYRLLATLPGVKVAGQVTDTLGRRAIEVTYKLPEPSGSDDQLELALLFDPKTYVLLDTLTTETGKDASSSDTAFVRSGLVSRIGALPKGQPATAISKLVGAQRAMSP